MTKVEKVKKLMEKYGVSLSDLEDVDDEEVKPTEPKEEETETEKVEEPKETEKAVEEETKVENETTEESKVEITDIYKTQFEDLNKQIADLKALIEAQSAKTDKAYEMLDAQGKTPDEEEYEYAQKLGSSDIRPTLNSEEKGGEEFANALQSKKVR